jgi:hypothetical protein
LALQLAPPEVDSCVRVCSKVACFLPLVVGEEDKPLFIESFQQHHPHAGLASIVDGGKSHSGWFRNFRFHSLPEPLRELGKWVRIKLRFGQSSGGVFLADVSK